MTLLVPYATIAPVAAAFSRHDEEAPDARPAHDAAAVNHELSRVDVTLRAEVADTRLTLERGRSRSRPATSSASTPTPTPS